MARNWQALSDEEFRKHLSVTIADMLCTGDKTGGLISAGNSPQCGWHR